MPDGPDLTVFQRRLAERRAKEEAARKKDQFDEDLIPEESYDKTDADAEIDRIVGNIDIIDAYRRWCGKMVPVVRGTQTEGVKISCPIPGHVDSDPSAWISTEKQVWFCGGCQQGGDAHDLAAFHFGFNVPGYKDGADFHKLRIKMAEDYGYTIKKHPGGVITVVPPLEPEPVVEDEDVPDNVVPIQDDDDFDEDAIIPVLPWRKIVPEDTFLDAYMKATVIDDAPEEYHFFHGLLAIGLAIGRDVTLFDSTPIFGNLFVCTLGSTGIGKSKAKAHLDRLLSRALPHDWSNPNSKGIRRISAPASAEVLIHRFMKPVEDPTNPKKVAYYAPVRGMIDFNELSSLTARMNRMGSALEATLQAFYDMDSVIETDSMTHNLKHAEDPFGCVLTTTQTKSLRNLLTKENVNSGFLNRWVFIPGTEKKRFSVGGAIVDINPAIKPLQDIHGWAGTFKSDEHMEWSVEAFTAFDKFFQNTVLPDKKRIDNDLIKRLDLLVKKLILLFAANRKEKTVSVRSIEDMIACYPYLLSSFGIPADQIGNTLTNEITERILHYAKKHPEGITMRQLSRHMLQRNKYDAEMVNRIVDALVKIERLKIEKANTGRPGRPTVRYQYVD